MARVASGSGEHEGDVGATVSTRSRRGGPAPRSRLGQDVGRLPPKPYLRITLGLPSGDDREFTVEYKGDRTTADQLVEVYRYLCQEAATRDPRANFVSVVKGAEDI